MLSAFQEHICKGCEEALRLAGTAYRLDRLADAPEPETGLPAEETITVDIPSLAAQIWIYSDEVELRTPQVNQTWCDDDPPWENIVAAISRHLRAV